MNWILEPTFLFFFPPVCPPFVFLYVCSAGFWVLISGEVIVARGRGRRAALLMLYKQAEGERQRRPRPIQRPQCNSSHMPSIPMRCVKVEPAKSSWWTFLRRATLDTHRQSSDRSLWCLATAAVLSALRVCASEEVQNTRINGSHNVLAN